MHFRALDNLDRNGKIPYKRMVEIVEEEIVNKYPSGKKFLMRRFIMRFIERHCIKLAPRTENPRTYECDLCSSAYTFKNSLQKHYNKVHLLL